MTCKAAWWTDIHFELLGEPARADALREWQESRADCAIVTGDISSGQTSLKWLREMALRFSAPIYFVLGNHDFFGTSIARRRKEAGELAAEANNLIYLTAGGIVPLSPTTALVGHDGWGDARGGDYENTPIRPPDLGEIEDFRVLGGDRTLLRRRLEQLGDEAAEHLAVVLPEALSAYPQVVVATHVPPFRETAWYGGHNSDANWLPFFCCQAAGAVLRRMAEYFPQRKILVLCGHCHGSGDVEIRDNLRVITAGGEPCTPHVQRMFEFAA